MRREKVVRQAKMERLEKVEQPTEAGGCSCSVR